MKRFSIQFRYQFLIEKMHIVPIILLYALLVIFSSGGCSVNENSDNLNCEPVCSAVNECKDDGCGGICGCVDETEQCNDDGVCDPSGACSGECGDRECGVVCGEVCGDDPEGQCDTGQKCIDGRCVCEPDCDNIHCGQDDGCGGRCGCTDGKTCDEATETCVGGEGACDERECGTWDGEYCGACPDELLCNADGKCVDECDDLCSDVGWECDESICHDECGQCPENEACVNHICVCRPQCEPGSCSDGCGGTCPCNVGQKCDFDSEPWRCVDCTAEDTCGEMECGEVCGYPCGDNDGECGEGETCVQNYCYPSTLKMSLVKPVEVGDDGNIHGSLKIDYLPRPDEPRPRMADLRILPNRDAGFEIESVILGGAATAAKKSLYEDPIMLKPWRYRPDGSVQFLIHTEKADIASADEVFAEGALLTVNFVVELANDDAVTASAENTVELAIVRRDQTFAPFDADIALQETTYEQAVTVTK